MCFAGKSPDQFLRYSVEFSIRANTFENYKKEQQKMVFAYKEINDLICQRADGNRTKRNIENIRLQFTRDGKIRQIRYHRQHRN